MIAISSTQNRAMPTHFNNTLPPVGPKLLLKLENNEYKVVTRPNWITKQDNQVAFIEVDTEIMFYIEKSRIWWTYP